MVHSPRVNHFFLEANFLRERLRAYLCYTMLIAVDTRFLFASQMAEYNAFTQEVFVRLARLQPNHRFIFFVDKLPIVSFGLPPNVSVITITPKPKNFISYKWWYNVKLALALRKHKPNVFIGSYGLCSTTTPIPQLLIVHDLSFLHKQSAHPKHSSLFYKKSTKNCQNKAADIATVSQAVKDEIVSAYQFSGDKITVCGSAGRRGIVLVEWAEKEATKERYTQGCEYFVYHVTDNSATQFIHVLKAFSLFKKWQRSNIKLVVTGHSFDHIKQEQQKLKTYKFRSDVILLEHLPQAEMELLTGSAYAVVYPVLYEGFSQLPLECMTMKVPVIAYDIPVVKEMCGDVALYVYPGNESQLADQMKLLYKDENRRNQLIEKGVEKAKEYSWDKTVSVIWEMVKGLR